MSIVRYRDRHVIGLARVDDHAFTAKQFSHDIGVHAGLEIFRAFPQVILVKGQRAENDAAICVVRCPADYLSILLQDKLKLSGLQFTAFQDLFSCQHRAARRFVCVCNFCRCSIVICDRRGQFSIVLTDFNNGSMRAFIIFDSVNLALFLGDHIFKGPGTGEDKGTENCCSVRRGDDNAVGVTHRSAFRHRCKVDNKFVLILPFASNQFLFTDQDHVGQRIGQGRGKGAIDAFQGNDHID